MWKKENGSVLVGVLVSMVFIGIVTTSMINNTRSQSAATSDYGTISVMESTAGSGMIATQSYLINAVNKSAVEAILTEFVNDTTGVYRKSIFSSGKTKFQLADNQFFRSEMTRFDSVSRNAKFQIVSGKSASGRDIKGVSAFFHMENLTITQENNIQYDSDKAIYMAGSLQDGNNGMIVDKGKAKFEGDVTFQNKDTRFYEEVCFKGDSVKFNNDSIQFDKDVYAKSRLIITGQASVDFNGRAFFGGGVNKILSSGVNFYDFVRFDSSNSQLTIQNQGTNTMFHKDVYFDTDISATNPIYVGGDVYYEPGSIGSLHSIVKNGAAAGKFWHRETKDPNTTGKLTNLTRPHEFKDNVKETLVVGVNDIKAKTDYDGVEPRLNMSKMNVTPVNIFDSIAPYGTFNFSALQKKYNDEIQKDNSNHLFNGHLVVNIGSQFRLTVRAKDNVFNGKVIFLVRDGGIVDAGDGEFYISGASASTLVHVSGTGYLVNFGTRGLFRGFIYFDDNNDPPGDAKNSFMWGNNSKILGAIHNFSSDHLVWNTGGGGKGKPTTITFDKDVLGAFALLTCSGANCGSGEKNVTINDAHLKIAPIGYYFH